MCKGSKEGRPGTPTERTVEQSGAIEGGVAFDAQRVVGSRLDVGGPDCECSAQF